MGINTRQSNGNKVSVKYSAFLGMFFVDTPETKAALARVRSEIGEEEWKKGFTGSRGDSPSARARDALSKDGVVPFDVSGVLSSAWIAEEKIGNTGRTAKYLKVSLKDGDDRYYLSLDLGNDGAQMLVRKLANAEIGRLTVISMFATYEQREGQARAYANHGCSMKQEGAGEVKSVSVDGLRAQMENAIAALDDDSAKDKEIVNRRRAKVREAFHVALIDQLKARIDAYYKERELRTEGASAPATSAAQGDDIYDDGIPF